MCSRPTKCLELILVTCKIEHLRYLFCNKCIYRLPLMLLMRVREETVV